MQELISLNNWKGDILEFEYHDMSQKYIEEKASNLHSMLEMMPQYHLATKMMYNEEEGHTLKVVITQNGKQQHQRKENTHEQETDIQVLARVSKAVS